MKLLIPIIAVAAATETAVKTETVKKIIPIQTYQQYTANAGNLLKTNTAASAASILKPQAPKPFAMDPMMMMMLMDGKSDNSMLPFLMMNQGGEGGMNPMMMMQLLGGDEDSCKPSDKIDGISGISDDEKEAIAKGEKFYDGTKVVSELKEVTKEVFDKAAAYFDYAYAKCASGGSGMDSMLPLLMSGGMDKMDPMMMMMLMGGKMDPMMMMLMGGNMGSMNPMMMMMLMGSDGKEECIKENELKFAFNVVLADSKYTVSKVTGSKDIQSAIEGKAYALPEGAAKDLLKCLEKDEDEKEDSFSKMLPFLMMMNQPKPVVTANGQTVVQKPAMDPLMMMLMMKGM